MIWFTQLKINRIIKQLISMHQYRTLNQPSDQILRDEIAIYFRLADIYAPLHGHKKYPFAREQTLACYRAAASLNDANAQYLLGKALLDEAKFRDELQRGAVFASESNARETKQRYDEALAFLTVADEQNHIQAKRLLGLCYINGWGVAPDSNKGFDLIVASIEQENSWDRVQKVFAEIGINKPAFFSALFQHRNKK